MRRLLSALALSLGLCSALQAERQTIQMSTLGVVPGAGSNASIDIASALGRLPRTKADTLRLVFSPGQYTFRAEGAPTRQVYISNHDQLETPRAFGMLLEGYRHIEIDGLGGVQFVFEDAMLPIGIINSEGIHIRGLSIDYRYPTITQVRIVENRGKSGGMRFRPEPWVQGRINADGAWEAYGRNWHSTLGSGIVFDSLTRNTQYRVADLSYSTKEASIDAEGIVHAPHWQDERLPVGAVVAMRSYYRPQPAIFVDASKDIRLTDVVVHYADGMGLLAQNSHNLTLTGFDVRPSAGRYFSTQADATHFSGCSGHIEVVRGRYEAMMDDAINVHGVYLQLTKRLDDHTIEAVYRHSQAWGFEWGVVGDTVQFVESLTFDVVPERRVIRAITPVDRPSVDGAKAFRIRFDKALPKSIRPEVRIGLENMRKIPSVTFSHCHILRNRARGTLFNTSKLVLVENNYFDHISGSGILVSSDCNMWFESGQTRKMIIRGNVFEDVLTSLYQFTEGVISICPVIPDMAGQRQPFYGDGGSGILIERNVFKTFDTPLLYAQSVDGLVWRDNQVITTDTYPKYHHHQTPYVLKGSKNISILTEERTPE